MRRDASQDRNRLDDRRAEITHELAPCCPATAREMNDHGVDVTTPVIRVLDTDPATRDLLKEWLTSAGFAVANANDGGAAALMIVEVPFTRHGGRDVVQRASAQYPGTPILALSPTFFSNVECGGNCARSMGVAGVLPKPIGRDTLIATVRNLLHPRE